MHDLEFRDILYVHDINTASHLCARKEKPFYQLCIRPVYNNKHKHFVYACSNDLNVIKKSIIKIVSKYKTVDEFFEVLDNLSNGGRAYKKMREYMDEWYNSNKKEVKYYNSFIRKAIAIGKMQTMAEGINLSYVYLESKRKYKIDGLAKDWVKRFLNVVLHFEGNTKAELFDELYENELIGDVYTMNTIFAELKYFGINSISKMKNLSLYRWLDILYYPVNNIFAF